MSEKWQFTVSMTIPFPQLTWVLVAKKCKILQTALRFSPRTGIFLIFLKWFPWWHYYIWYCWFVCHCQWWCYCCCSSAQDFHTLNTVLFFFVSLAVVYFSVDSDSSVDKFHHYNTQLWFEILHCQNHYKLLHISTR